MKQPTEIVEYACTINPTHNHRRITFGQTPNWWPNQRSMPINYYLVTTNFFDKATPTINTYCEGCASTVPMTRIGPQPK